MRSPAPGKSLSLRQDMSASLFSSLIIHHPLSHHTSHSAATEQHPSRPFINTSSALGATHPPASMRPVCALPTPPRGAIDQVSEMMVCQ